MKNKPHNNKLKKVSGIIKVISKPMGFVVVDKPVSSKGSSPLRPSVSVANKDDDIVVFEEGLNCALDKDEVEVEIIGRDRDRKKGRVTKIIKRHKTEFVGTLDQSGSSYFFLADDFKFYRKVDIRVLPEGAQKGEKVLVKIKEWTNPNLNPLGEIIKVIGKKGEHETEMQSILLDKGIVYDFPLEVEREAEKEAEAFRKSLNSEGLENRMDFRKVTTFTIDPKDAKDFDDALSYRDLGNGKIEVGVHIADVSHFVRPGTALDREARERSFSTYLVDRTIPMLPEVLSNELCSLMPNVDRFAFSAIFEIEKETGKVLDRSFGKTIINSDKRFSYEEAQDELEAESLELGGKNFRNELKELNRIAKIYRAENKKNGAIEFETDEVKFELDEKGKPIRVYRKARLATMEMIEQWMLLANREVAKFLSDKIKKNGAGASIFRIHNLPKMERIEELAVFVRALGHELPIKNGEVTAQDINFLLKSIEGHASESLIKTATIRSMAKAIYSTKNIGHFGLAFEYYTHFTSPIRRYPDLMIHRILQNHLGSSGHVKISKDEFSKFEKIAMEASEKEIVIAEAERESIKYKQVEFMQSKVGEEFDAVISGVTEWGMYVEYPETKAEGMVRLKDLQGDSFELDQKNYCLVGTTTGKKYSLGDSVRVKLISADLDRKTLDFKLVS